MVKEKEKTSSFKGGTSVCHHITKSGPKGNHLSSSFNVSTTTTCPILHVNEGYWLPVLQLLLCRLKFILKGFPMFVCYFTLLRQVHFFLSFFPRASLSGNMNCTPVLLCDGSSIDDICSKGSSTGGFFIPRSSWGIFFFVSFLVFKLLSFLVGLKAKLS